ncbi:hypothetical protein C8J56DRAFT_1055103 [Mycena floridula]|nr:hypothetical protein C8J56DRAFT_1055103 [Mycena floridula]
MAAPSNLTIPVSAAQARLSDSFVWARKGRIDRLVSATDASNTSIAVPPPAVFTITGRVSPVNFFTGMTGNVLTVDGIRVLEKAKYTVQLMNHTNGHADFGFIRENFSILQNQIAKSSKQEDFICEDRFRFMKDVFSPLAGAPLDPTMQTWTGPARLKSSLDDMKATHRVHVLNVLDLEGLPVAPFDIRDEIEAQLVEIDFHFQHQYIGSVGKDNFNAEIVEIRVVKERDEEFKAKKAIKMAPVFNAVRAELVVKEKGKEKEKEFRTLLPGEIDDTDKASGSAVDPDGKIEGSESGASTLESAAEIQAGVASVEHGLRVEAGVQGATRSSGRKRRVSETNGLATGKVKKIRIAPLPKSGRQ